MLTWVAMTTNQVIDTMIFRAATPMIAASRVPCAAPANSPPIQEVSGKSALQPLSPASAYSRPRRVSTHRAMTRMTHSTK
jgi:hypothetical protein